MLSARRLVALVVLVCALAVPSGAQATLVTAGADGVLRITSQTTADSGKGISAILLDHGGSLPTGTQTVAVHTGGLAGTPFERVETLNFDPASASWCRPQLSGAFVVSVACDTAAIERIDISTGDGDDSVIAQALTNVGDHSPSDPSTDPAIDVSLGTGNDLWAGSVLSEVVRDGLGTDVVWGYSLPSSGNDLFVQPDTPNPAVEDRGDVIDSDYDAGTVSYAARSVQGVQVRNRDWMLNDGAPGENDDIRTFGVVGTRFDDELNGNFVHGGAGADRLRGTGFEDGPTTLYGEQGDDELLGGEGADLISGGDGADRIVSDIGLDEIDAGDGDDAIGADDGDPDTVTCGAGSDAVTADPPATDAAIETPGCESVIRIVAEPVETFITSRPSPATNDTTPTVTFTSNYPTARFECSFDGSPYVPCLPTVTSAPLPDGIHTLLVRARRGTRVDETPAEVTTRVDTVDPETEVGAPATAHDELDLELGSNETEVRYECSIDGGAWTACADPLDVSALAVGNHTVAVRAIDAATNVDDTAATREFGIVNAVPRLAPTASPSSGSWDLDVALSLQADDPDGDALSYRVDFGDGTTVSTGSVGSQPIAHTYTETGVYVISAVVRDGRAEASATTTVTVTEPEPLRAAAGDDVVTMTATPVSFDASASRPPAGIGTYTWDFGDGQTANGARATHAYAAPGTYTTTLTVRRKTETSTDTRVVDVRAPAPTGLDVSVRGDGAPLPDADVIVYDPQGRAYPAVSGADGTARIGALADGQHRVLAYAPGFTPRAVTATTANGSGTVTVDLESGSLAQADLTSRRLTREEIIERGIDPDVPDNQVVYDITLNIEGAPTLSGSVTGNRFVGAGGGGGGGGWDCDEDECTSSPPACGCRVHVRTKDGALTTLVVPARASTLKEFFEVRLLVSNLAPAEFPFAGAAANLALPPGLSLAPTSTPQQPTKALGTIPGGQSREAHWIVRGDEEGSYDLEATFGAILQPFGRPVGLTARTRTPLKVWGASALRLRIEADDVLAAGYPYTVRVGLENVADVPLYDAALTLADTGAHGYIRQPRQRRSHRVTTLAPGETSWAGPFVLVPKASGSVSLAESFVGSLRGDGAVQATIATKPRTPALDNAPDLRATRRTETSLTLDWDPVAGATEYAVFRTADRDTEFPDDPLGPAVVKPITDTRVVVADAQFPQAGSDRQYAISALVGGVWTMVHPLADEHLPVAEPSPDVDIAYVDRCAQDGILLKAAFRSEDVPLVRWEWREDDGEWKLGGTLDGGGDSVATMLRRENRLVTWISVRVTDAIGESNTESSLVGQCDHNDPRNVPAGIDEDTPWWEFPDTDGDGLADHWERHGVWVGTKKVDLAALGADPLHKDAFAYVDRVEGERWNDRIEGIVEDSFFNSPLSIRMHFIRAPRDLKRAELPMAVDATYAFFSVTDQLGYLDSGLGGATGSVPPLAKYVCVCPDHVQAGTSGEADNLKGAHLVVTVNETRHIDAMIRAYNRGQWPLVYSTSDDFIKDRFNASTVMHELGHLYGLHHHGAEGLPVADPDYKSIMSYVYTTFGVPRREGAATRYTIDFSRDDVVNLDWRLGGETGALSLVGGQHGEHGDFYLRAGEPIDLEPAPDEPSIDELLADPETAEAIVDGLVATAEEGRQDAPADPSTPSTPASPSQPQGGGQATAAKLVVRVPRRVTRAGLRKGLQVRVEGARPEARVAATLVRNGRKVATGQVLSDAAGRARLRLRVSKAAARSLRKTSKLQLRIAYSDTLGTARQAAVKLRLSG